MVGVSQSIQILISGVGAFKEAYKTYVPINRWEPICCKAIRKWAAERFLGIRYGSIPFCGKPCEGTTQGSGDSCNSQTLNRF